MRSRSRIIGFGSAALLVVAGIAGSLGFSGTFGQVLAIVLVGVGLVLATALIFYEVGLSEDRERAEEESRRERAQPEHGPPRPQRRARRLDRLRGERRRLR